MQVVSQWKVLVTYPARNREYCLRVRFPHLRCLEATPELSSPYVLLRITDISGPGPANLVPVAELPTLAPSKQDETGNKANARAAVGGKLLGFLFLIHLNVLHVYAVTANTMQ